MQNNMDFTPELTAFQGVIISADNVHTFTRLTARGGNEDQIDYVVNNLHKFLEQQQYIVQNQINLEKLVMCRKIAFYIILNADLPSLETLVENGGIDSVIWTVPTIPKCLMSEMLWKLHMDKFIYEAVAFSCPELALELASALIDHLKYFTPAESLSKTKTLSLALYKLICRLNFFNYENDVQSNLLTTASNYLQKCLDYFIEPPKAGLLVNLKKDELYKFKGNCLETMLHLIFECITEFTSVQEFSPNNFSAIYQLTYKVGSYKEEMLNFATCNTPNKAILECLDKNNELLLDKFKVLVMDVSVDIFCAWSEFEQNGKSMQEVIGELCYKLRTKLLNTNVISEHPVVNMIQQISRKPVDIQEIVNSSDSDAIAENIQKNIENRLDWVRAVLQRDNLCNEMSLIEILYSNLDILNEEECHNLYKICQVFIRNNSQQNLENVKLWAVKAFQKCDINAKYDILEEHFKEKCFTDCLETLEFNDMMTEIFNKVISDKDADLSDILTVFLQNPQKMYTKIFTLSAESSQQTDIMLKAIALVYTFSNHYYIKDTEPCIIRVAETVLDNYIERDSTQHNFINFICGLKKSEIIPGNKLLLLIIMPQLHKALLEKHIRRIHFQCKLLSESFTIQELIQYRAPMLAMLAQILEVVRWKITTYIPEGPSAVLLALQIQKELISTYEDGFPEKEENWLKSKLQKMHPLNNYYYRKLWNPRSGDNLVVVASGMHIQDMDNAQLISWLSQVLPSCIQPEWCAIWDSLTMFSRLEKLDIIHRTLTSITKAEAMYRESSNSWECVQECYRNFVYVVRYKYLTEPLSDEQVTTIIQKITAIANLTSEDLSEQLSVIFTPLFAYIVSQKDEYTVNIANLISESLKNNTFKEKMDNIFTNEAV